MKMPSAFRAALLALTAFAGASLSSAAHADSRGEFGRFARLSVRNVSASPPLPAVASDSAYAHIDSS